jgi:hypothetical protein
VICLVEITFYDSWEQAMEEERKAREEADARVQPWQFKCRAGDILVSDPGYGFPVFHELLDNEKIVGENLEKYGDDFEDEAIYTLDIYNQPHMRFYRFCRNYSEVAPEGELGDIHLSIAFGRIDREGFEYLKARGFSPEG